MRFYNKISGPQRPRNENGHAYYSLCARSISYKCMHVSRIIYERLDACVFLASVAGVSYLLSGFARAVSYTHVYLASI